MNKSIGDTGEKIAESYLKEKGYKILDKNFRYSKLGEIDLVAQRGAEVMYRVADYLADREKL